METDSSLGTDENSHNVSATNNITIDSLSSISFHDEPEYDYMNDSFMISSPVQTYHMESEVSTSEVKYIDENGTCTTATVITLAHDDMSNARLISAQPTLNTELAGLLNI